MLTYMNKNDKYDSLEERNLFVNELAFLSFIVPFLLVLLTMIGTTVWTMTVGPGMMGSWDDCLDVWFYTNIIVCLLVFVPSYLFSLLVESSFCALVSSVSNFKNIPSFTESPKLNVLLLLYGFKIRRFVSGCVITDFVIDDRIKQAHKKVEDILSEPAVVDVIKNGQSRHFKNDVVASVTEVVKGAIREVDEISKNAKIENNNKTIKQNEESDHRVVEFLAREK